MKMLDRQTDRQTDVWIIHKPLNEYSKDDSFNAIDVAKFVCAIMVVIIHITPFADERLIILIDIKSLNIYFLKQT